MGNGTSPLAKRLRTILLVGGSAFVLAACGGGGGGGGGNPPPPEPPPPPPPPPSDPYTALPSPTADLTLNWLDGDVSGQFNPILAEQIRTSARFRLADYDGWNPSFTGSPYELIRLHVAHAAGFTGEGQVIAIMDDGFLTTHAALAPQIVGSFGFVGLDGNSGHGTHVAALAAGSAANPSQMTGVAPGAGLFLTTYLGSAQTLANATIAAANAGAVVQNNSWGWLSPGGSVPASANDEVRIDDLLAYQTANSVTDAQALTAAFGDTNANYNAYIAALDKFQATGVIVVALSNDESLGNADVNAALPLLATELEGAWIAVANGLFNLDANLNVTASQLISAPCGDAAAFCLTADGTTTSAGIGWDTDFTSQGTGTSYAAPQVSGAVAIMAQAFPNLSPEEWADRLFASANSAIPGFDEDGKAEFGNNGVLSYYDTEFGHGTLDIAAALSPIGTLVMVQGKNLAEADRFELTSSFLDSGDAMGDALFRALSGTDIAVFDGLNGDFYLDAGLLATETGSTGLLDSPAIPRLAENGGLDFERNAGSWGFIAGETPVENTIGSYTVGLSAIDGHTYLQDTLGLSSENVAGASVLGLSENTTAVVGRYDMGFAEFQQFGFVGTHSENADGMMAGVGGALAFDLEGFGLTLGATQISEQGGFLGMTTSEAFALPGQTAITAASLAATADITSSLSVFGGLEYGVAFGSTGSGLVAELGQATFSGFQVGVRTSGLFQPTDQLTFTASQPMRVETGSIALDVPTGRLPNGDIVYGMLESPLEASGRQIDLGLSYAFEPAANALMRFGVVYSLDAGHVAGREAAAVAASFTQSF